MKMVVFKMMTSATFHAICRPYTLTVGPPFRDIQNGTLLTEAIRKCPHKQFRDARNTERRYFILETSISNLHMNSIQIRHLSAWRHFTSTTRMLFVFPFIFKFGNPSEVKKTKALICRRKQNPEGFWS